MILFYNFSDNLPTTCFKWFKLQSPTKKWRNKTLPPTSDLESNTSKHYLISPFGNKPNFVPQKGSSRILPHIFFGFLLKKNRSSSCIVFEADFGGPCWWGILPGGMVTLLSKDSKDRDTTPWGGWDVRQPENETEKKWWGKTKMKMNKFWKVRGGKGNCMVYMNVSWSQAIIWIYFWCSFWRLNKLYTFRLNLCLKWIAFLVPIKDPPPLCSWNPKLFLRVNLLRMPLQMMPRSLEKTNDQEESSKLPRICRIIEYW